MLVASFYNKPVKMTKKKVTASFTHTSCFTILSSIFDVQRTVNKFDVSSTRFCSVCKIEVKVASGGEANWTTHTSSSAHRKKRRHCKQHHEEDELLRCDAPGCRLTVSVLSRFGNKTY